MADDAIFDRIFDLLLGHEGGFQQDKNDRGNWTGGVVGAGVLRGTKYGISAAAYPDLDIERLTVEQVKAIYEKDYYRATRCQDLAPPLALLMFDAAVNNGQGNAIRFLQRAVDVADDGRMGPVTMAAIGRLPMWDTAEQFQRQRIRHMKKLSDWPRYGAAWAERLVAIAVQAVALPAWLNARND